MKFFWIGLLLKAACQLSAQDLTLSLGTADELDGESTELFELSWRFANSPLPLSDKLELLAAHIRARDTALLNNDITYVGLGVRKYWLPKLFSGFAVAAVSDQNEALSSSYQFVSTLGYQWRRSTVAVRHLSNAGTGGRNRGETYFAIGLNF